MWWDEAVNYHVKSSFYDVNGFLENTKKLTLGQLERKEVGDVAGKDLLHLQCHFGLDTLSWQRLGASCTGVDISEKAIRTAHAINEKLKLGANFLCSDIYNLPDELNNSYDVVFSSYGVLCWLKDLDEYAKIVASKLKSGGFYYLAELHPFFNLFDIGDDTLKRKYESGRETTEIIGSYIENKKSFEGKQTHFSFTISSILNALIKANLQIEFLHEFNYSTYMYHSKLQPFKSGLAFEEDSKLPLIFSLKAHKE